MTINESTGSDVVSDSTPFDSAVAEKTSCSNTAAPSEARRESGATATVNATVTGDLRVIARRRTERLERLSEVDPSAAAPGLALSRALESAYAGDHTEMRGQLLRAAGSLGLLGGAP